jgi:tetratricopeptide (TPR) repeat protein
MSWFSKGGPGARQDDANVEAMLRRGFEYQDSGEFAKAEECFRQILSQMPEHAATRRQLANLLAFRAFALQERGELPAAIEGYEESLALDFAQARVHNNLGNAYKSLGRAEEAIAAYREAIAVDAGQAEAHKNLGTALVEKGERGLAIAHYRAAVESMPSYAEASHSLGVLLEQEGDPAGALECYRAAIASNPDYAEAHWNFALQSLLLGEFGPGWRAYEWRTRLPNLERPWPYADRDHWDGEPLEGKVILLHAEQGFGDAIQFVRYAPLVAARGGRVIVSCQPKLKALLQCVQGVSAVLIEGEPPPFDVCASLMSLPRIFETTLKTIPAPIPYIRPDPEKARHWKGRLAAHGAPLKVGLFWATDAKSTLSPLKSLTLDMLAPLGGDPGVLFFSLQQGAAAGQASHPPGGMAMVDLGAELGDFSDTAALISNLDLIISIDTATAHLAGAMGLPVWTLTHFPPDWRWLIGRGDSPWYPTMRLFRKGGADTWAQVIGRVGEALRQLAGRRFS